MDEVKAIYDGVENLDEMALILGFQVFAQNYFPLAISFTAQKPLQAAFFRFPSPSQAAFARSAAFHFLIETLRPVLPNQYDTLTFQRKSTYGFRP